VIRSFRHKGLKAFFDSGTTRGIQAKHAERLRRQLAALDRARGPNDLAVPGWRLHPLQGRQKDRWALWVDENWRLTFAFIQHDIELLDYIDYH
jgi:proteic killer suppression protein